MFCHYCDKIGTTRPICREIAKVKHSKAVLRKKTLSFLFEEFNSLRKQLKPTKAENPKKRKTESTLSTEINLTNSSDEMEEYVLLFPPAISRPSIKLVENSLPTTELVVTLNVNHEEHVLRAPADIGPSSSIILEAYTQGYYKRIFRE
jgi:hypothetical protein